MSEAKPLYDEILRALALVLPRTVYRDVRRVRTVAWAMTGLCLTQRVSLSAWASVRQSRSQFASLRERSFSYWLHHAAIVPRDWYRPVIQAALSAWPCSGQLFVALDTTLLSPFVLICASLVYRGRTIPLTWRVMRHASAQVGFQDYEPVLLAVHALLPDHQLTLLADRGFAHVCLLRSLQRLAIPFRLRLPGDTLVYLQGSWIVPVKALCPAVGQVRFVQQVALFEEAVGPVCLALAAPQEYAADPWFVASSEHADASTLRDYRLRFDVEESFKDAKAGGFQLQHSRLADPAAFERLLLIVALTTLYLTSLGISIVQAGRRRFVDPHWGRGLSSLQLGVRGVRQQVQYDWQAFVPFQLDPAPDPLPLPASQRLKSAWSDQDYLAAAA